MRINIVLDDDLVKEALKYSKAKTKKELIVIALKEFVENRRRMNLLELEGKIEFARGYNYKSLRKST